MYKKILFGNFIVSIKSWSSLVRYNYYDYIYQDINSGERDKHLLEKILDLKTEIYEKTCVIEAKRYRKIDPGFKKLHVVQLKMNDFDFSIIRKSVNYVSFSQDKLIFDTEHLFPVYYFQDPTKKNNKEYKNIGSLYRA